MTIQGTNNCSPFGITGRYSQDAPCDDLGTLDAMETTGSACTGFLLDEDKHRSLLACGMGIAGVLWSFGRLLPKELRPDNVAGRLLDTINNDPFVFDVFNLAYADYRPSVGGRIEPETLNEIMATTGLTPATLINVVRLLKTLERNDIEHKLSGNVNYLADCIRYIVKNDLTDLVLKTVNNLESKTVSVSFEPLNINLVNHRVAALDMLSQISTILAISEFERLFRGKGIGIGRIEKLYPELVGLFGLKEDLSNGRLKILYVPGTKDPAHIYIDGQPESFIAVPFIAEGLDAFFTAFLGESGDVPAAVILHELEHERQWRNNENLTVTERESKAYATDATYSTLAINRRYAKRTIAEGIQLTGDAVAETFSTLSRIFPDKTAEDFRDYLLGNKCNYFRSASVWANDLIGKLRSPDGVFEKNSERWSNELHDRLSSGSLIGNSGRSADDTAHIAFAFGSYYAFFDLVTVAVRYSKDMNTAIDASKKRLAIKNTVDGNVFMLTRQEKNLKEMEKFIAKKNELFLSVMEDIHKNKRVGRNLDETGYILHVHLMLLYCSYVSAFDQERAFTFFEKTVLPFLAAKNALQMETKDIVFKI